MRDTIVIFSKGYWYVTLCQVCMARVLVVSTPIVQAVDGISSSISSNDISDDGIIDVNVNDGVILVTDIYSGSVRDGSACVLCCVLYTVCAFMQCGLIRIVICGV